MPRFEGSLTLLNELIGQKITIHSTQGETERQDIGVLQGVDGIWVKLQKENGEILFFCVYRIRMIKSF